MKKKLNDTWLRVLSIPLLAVAAVIIIDYKELFLENRISIDTLYYFFALTFCIATVWQVNLFIHFRVRRHYEQFKDKRKFIHGWLLRLLLYGVNAVTIILVATLVINYKQNNFSILVFQFAQTLSFALLFSYLIAGFYETRYFIYEWGKSHSEAEDLKRLNLQIQVDSLRNQINPHFLFNSLNTLSSLVNTEKSRAEKFIDEMSTVYRYVLLNNEKELTTLGEELDFITAYVQMLQTRYEDGMKIEFAVETFYLDHLLPPLTLQLLVENAVKHNIVSANKPLHIKIYTDDMQQLVVENNFQQKATPVKSNRMGLTNIFAKYNLLNQPQIVVNQTGKVFQVVLALIGPGQIKPANASLIPKQSF